jgi:hypothetical protein
MHEPLVPRSPLVLLSAMFPCVHNTVSVCCDLQPPGKTRPSATHSHHTWFGLLNLNLKQTEVTQEMSVGDIMGARTAAQESGRLPPLRDDTTVQDQVKALAWDSLEVSVTN